MSSKGNALRELIEAPEILVSPGIFDGFSARLVERAGFKSAAISGAGLSESRLGWADMGIMGYEQNLEACRAIANCTDLLLQADADTGYGNPVNVHFVVRGFENAGVAAVMIEDQVWPKRCGHLPGKQVIPSEDMVEKVKAAVDARRDPDFLIKARTDAAGPLGLNAAIDRLNMYAEAGADFLFADALVSEDDIREVARNTPKPLTVNMGLGLHPRKTTPLLSPRQLQDLGVAAVSYPRMLSSAAIRGMINALDAFENLLRSPTSIERPELLVSFEEINELMGIGDLNALERRYGSAI